MTNQAKLKADSEARQRAAAETNTVKAVAVAGKVRVTARDTSGRLVAVDLDLAATEQLIWDLTDAYCAARKAQVA